MRKFSIILMALMFSFFSIKTVAYADHSTANDVLSFVGDDEYDDVLRAVSEYAQTEPDGIPDISYCYKCYNLSKSDFDDIKNANDIISKITSQQKYEWRAVTTNGNGILYLKRSENDTLKVYMYQPPDEEPRNKSYYDMNSTLNIINKNRKLENISDMYVIETALTTLCLLITLEDAHIITYSARPDFTGLKYGELYSVNRVISSMKKYFKGLGTTADTLRKQNIITASVVTE